MTDLEKKQMQKIDAEIAKLIAGTVRLNSSIDKEQTNAEIRKTNQETIKLSKEIFWYPVAIASGFIVAIGAIVKYIIS